MSRLSILSLSRPQQADAVFFFFFFFFSSDREAQRAIRERTKSQIDMLERKIQELTEQQPYQELQAVVRIKEAVERENADIRRQLATIVSLLQPLIGRLPPSDAVLSPPPSAPGPVATTPTPTPVPAVALSPDISYPSSSAQSFALVTHNNHQHQHQHHYQHQRQHQHPAGSMGPPNISPTPSDPASPGTSEHHTLVQSWHNSPGDPLMTQLSHQRRELRHGLEMGPERLGLGFLLDPSQTVAKIQSGINGAQDTPQFRHVPMKHDWTGAAHDQASMYTRAGPWAPGPSSHTDTIQHQDPNSHYSTAMTPYYANPVRNCGPTCPLDSLLLDFMAERRRRAADGLPIQEVVGPRYPSVSSLLNPANSVYSHPLSKVFTDILATFPDLSSLPERVAVLYIMFLVMRWQVSPTHENYHLLPDWMHPGPSQVSHPHPAWIDHLPFPKMREKLVHECNPPTDFPFDNFFIPFTTTLTLSWPYEETDTLLQSPENDELLINPVFERHLRDLRNWKLGPAFVKAFPALADTCNVHNMTRRPAAAPYHQ